MKLRLLFAGACLAVLIACGSISDPARSHENTGTVSGALSGVPAGARVALIWRQGSANAWTVAGDVPVIDGKFSIDITPPPGEWYARAEASFDKIFGPPSVNEEESDILQPEARADAGSIVVADAGDGVKPKSITPQDGVTGTVESGGGGSGALESALAGFIVYVDTNGNGKLDLEGSHLMSTDEIVGGNRQVLITYLRGGRAIDYEKLRDKAGILPHAGANVGWTEGRWLPANGIDLKAQTTTRLPFSVCTRFQGLTDDQACIPNTTMECDCGFRLSTRTCNPDGKDLSPCSCANSNLPQKGDPRLHCAADGSWTFDPNPACAEKRLCKDIYVPFQSASCGSYGSFAVTTPIPPFDPLPADWPCTVP